MGLTETLNLAFNSFEAGVESKREAIKIILDFISKNYEVKKDLDKMKLEEAYENYANYDIYIHCDNGRVIFPSIEN